MKKIYTFIVALMAMFATTAQAQIEVVTEIGPHSKASKKVRRLLSSATEKAAVVHS